MTCVAAAEGEMFDDSDNSATDNFLWNAALRLLARREHSGGELKNKLLLRVRGTNRAASRIDAVLDKLTREGFLDEVRFTKSYIRLSLEKGWGKVKIVHYLRSKGVADTHIQNCLEAYDERFWNDRAYELFQKKYGKVAPDPAARAGQQRFLAGRGFSYDQIKEAMQTSRQVSGQDSGRDSEQVAGDIPATK